MRVLIVPSAQKDIGRLPNDVRERIRKAVTRLEKEPPEIRYEQLKGLPKRYKIRVGDYRIILTLDDANTARIIAVGHRREIYE